MYLPWNHLLVQYPKAWKKKKTKTVPIMLDAYTSKKKCTERVNIGFTTSDLLFNVLQFVAPSNQAPSDTSLYLSTQTITRQSMNLRDRIYSIPFKFLLCIKVFRVWALLRDDRVSLYSNLNSLKAAKKPPLKWQALWSA